MIRRVSPTLLLCVLGCRSTPAPEPSAPVVPETGPATKAKPEPEAPPAPRPYELVWTAQLDGWNKTIEVTDGGDPIVINSRTAYLLARHDGSILEEAEIRCLPPHNGLFLFDANTGVIGCDDRIMELEMPGLNVRVAHQLPPAGRYNEIEAFSAQPGGAVYGTQSGRVVVLERQPPGYDTTAEWNVPGAVEAVALSPDRSTVVVGVNGKLGVEGKEAAFIEVYDAQTGELRQRSGPQTRSRVTAMSPSPDGAMVYANAGSFEAGIMEIATTSWTRNYEVGSWMSSSVWLSPTLVAGAGSDGTMLFSLERGGTHRLELPGYDHQPTMEGIGASGDGSFVCSGTRDGLIACWSNKDIEPSTYRRAPPLVR